MCYLVSLSCQHFLADGDLSVKESQKVHYFLQHCTQFSLDCQQLPFGEDSHCSGRTEFHRGETLDWTKMVIFGLAKWGDWMVEPNSTIEAACYQFQKDRNLVPIANTIAREEVPGAIEC